MSFLIICCRFGSSPRMRGTQRVSKDARYFVRFIPAYAGNTPNTAAPVFRSAVHPRVCGEHAWGLPVVDADLRFIPAYAGNTGRCQNNSGYQAVHPRVCGEHRAVPSLPCRCSGSSPRMRGTRESKILKFLQRRFIPAYAGNTRDKAWRYSLSAVHPRVCGEHIPPPRRACLEGGSSPRMRGTRPRPPRTCA